VAIMGICWGATPISQYTSKLKKHALQNLGLHEV